MPYKNKQDALEYERKWQKANRDKTRKYAETYRIKNYQKQLEAQRKWREKNKDYRKKYYQENKQRELELSSEYRKATPEQQAVYRKRHYEKYKDEMTANARKNYVVSIRKNRYERDRDRLLYNARVNNRMLMSIIFWHYSGGTYSCNCCGFSERKDFLEVDHIENNGNKHRREIGQSSFYRWILQNNLPKGFQILCANCNQGKRRNNGVCPHNDIENLEDMYIPPEQPMMIPHKYDYLRSQV